MNPSKNQQTLTEQYTEPMGSCGEIGTLRMGPMLVLGVCLLHLTLARADEIQPDTLKDGAQALADGRLDRDQIFRAGTVQAKCASKYESKPGLAPGQAAPNINAGKSSI